MKIIFLLSLATVLSLTQYNTAFAQTNTTVKANSENQPRISDVIVVNFNATATKDRILLNWTLDKNNVVDQIEVERGKDEKKFCNGRIGFWNRSARQGRLRLL